MDDLPSLIEKFIRKLWINDSLESSKEGVIEVYNEFSAQFELAIFLRNELDSKYKILLERNITDFGITEELPKSEIDLVVYNRDNKEKTAIEIKFPRGIPEGKEQSQGQTPLRMYACIRDIKFLEELKDRGFTKGFFILLTDNELFWRVTGKEQNQIYSYFRKEAPMRDKIKKSVGKEEEEPIELRGTYTVTWEPPLDKYKKSRYWIQQIK